MGIKYDVSLVLAAHGSEAAPDSNAPVVDLAAQIREREMFADVTPAFLLGEPNMTSVVEHLSSKEVVVVPLMTSAGYYLNSVIPKKLAANEDAKNRNWYISSVAGMHPWIAKLMVQRIRQQMETHALSEELTTIVLVGHGTRRNKNSAKSAFDLFKKIQIAFPNSRTRVAFLDQDPEAPLVAASILEGHTIIAPFLISRGPHTTVDVPEAFSFPGGPDVQFPIFQSNESRAGCRTTVCIEPLVLYPEILKICVELAIESIESNQMLSLPELEVA